MRNWKRVNCLDEMDYSFALPFVIGVAAVVVVLDSVVLQMQNLAMVYYIQNNNSKKTQNMLLCKMNLCHKDNILDISNAYIACRGVILDCNDR